MFFPRPARERGDRKVRDEKKEPAVEPGRAINIGPRHFRVEARFVKRAGDGTDDENGEQNDGELERREELKEAIALPTRARCCGGGSHADGYFPREPAGVQWGS